jgi:hypothetical protein
MTEDVLKQEQINSTAFQIAEMQRERLRSFGVIEFIGLFAAIAIIRVGVSRAA